MLVDLLLSLLGMILTIFIIVGIHEGAHFLVARLLGVKVLQCSIGFGKPLWGWHDKKGTHYVIAPIPLGGYVKMLDENEGDVPEKDRHLAFNRQPLYKRAAIVAAGPLSNLVLAFILYWVIFVSGFQTPVPIIGTVEPNSIASDAGLKPKQEIIEVDGHKTLSWASISMRLVVHTGDHDTIALKTLSTPQKMEDHTLNLDSWEMSDLKPDPLSSLGIVPFIPEAPLIVGKISPDSPAVKANIQIGDELVALNEQPIKNWTELVYFINKNPNQEIVLTVNRNHQKINLPVTIGHQRNLFFKLHGFLGIGPDFTFPENLLRKIQYGPTEAISKAFNEVSELTYFNLVLLGKLATAKLSVLSLGGPITIFEIAGNSFAYGIVPFLSFLAFLSVALGVINFIPIPGLDGGHLLFQLIEFIIRKPISIRTQMLFYRLGFIFLLIVFVQAITNDLLRLWN